ncbi:MAG: alpha/beta hydrolase family protein [Casimicrobium sp.]
MSQRIPSSPNFYGRLLKFSSFSLIAFFTLIAQFTWASNVDAGKPSESAPKAAATSPSGAFRPVDFSWKDSSRERDIPARLYWPEHASPSKQVPLVVFSHGLGGSQMGYSYLGRHWASLGIASLHVRHAGSDRGIWTANVFTLFSNMQRAASEENAIARAKDVSFAITQLLSETDYAKSINADAVAVAGHSYGANTAMLIGGATVSRDGKTLSWKDDRVKALILISAPPFTGEGDMTKILEDVKVPTLHVTGTEDIIRVPGYRSDYNDRLAVYDAQSSHAAKALTVFKGATHSIFTDRIDRAGLELNEKVKRATREISGLFLKSVLLGESQQPMKQWASTQDGLIEKFVPLQASN